MKHITHQRKIVFLWLGLLISMFPLKLTAEKIDTNYYEEGIELSKSGQYKEALNIWLIARSELAPEKIDPRIGFSFINLVAEQHLTKYYKTGTIMYLWALSGNSLGNFSNAIVDEIKRMKPLLETKKFREWKKLVNNSDPKVLSEILKFWGKLDPTINTLHNERLLEHWERIQYIKQNFNKNEAFIYPADPRGGIYIKYGSPDRIKKGSFRFNSPRISAWAQDMTILVIPNQRTISDTSATSLTAISATSSADAMAKNLTIKARDFFTYPEYEIWVYERYKNSDSGDNLIFIFGDDAASGDFELLDSLEDIIPSRAFNPSIGKTANPTATPGLLLQMLLYDQAAAVDSYFGNALMDLESEALSSTDAQPYLGSSARSKNQFRMSRIQVQAPNQTSSYQEKLPHIEMSIQQYRMLDIENRPYNMTYVYSSPFKIIFSALAGISNATSADLELEHTAQLRSAEWNLQANVTDAPPLIVGDEIEPVQSLFLLPYTGEKTQQIFGASLINKSQKDTANDEESIFPQQLIGLGKTTLSPPQPLSTDLERLEMADLILGYSGYLTNEDIPFYVPLEKYIPANKNLMLHFEIYHLIQNPTGIAQFTVEYKVIQSKKLSFLQKKDPEGSLLLNYETDKTYFKENLDISTRELKPGKYTLTLTVTDLKTEQQKMREVDFEVVPGSN